MEEQPTQGSAKSAEALVEKTDTEEFDMEAIQAEAERHLGVTKPIGERPDPGLEEYIAEHTVEPVADEQPAEPVTEETAPAESGDSDLDQAYSEIKKLREKLGKQGAERGALVDKLVAIEQRLNQQEQAQTQQQVPQTDRDIVRTLIPNLTDDEMEGDLGNFYERQGLFGKNLAAEILAIVKQDLDGLRGDFSAYKGKTTMDSLSAASGLNEQVRAELLQSNPGLAEISDPAQQVDMMRKLAIADGILANKQEPKAPPTVPSRNPATHVAGSGQSAGSTVPANSTFAEAIQRDIREADPFDEKAMQKISKAFAAEVDGDRDLGLGARNLFR